MKILQPSEHQLPVALLPEGGCLVTGFWVFLGSAIEEVTSPPRGPFLGLTVDSPAHSPQDSDHSSVIHATPGLTQLHHITLHKAPGQAVCAALSWQTWAQTHLPFPNCSPSWMSLFLSKPVSVPSCTWGWWPHGLLGMSSDIGGTRPGKYGCPCLRQAVPPAPVGSFYYLSLSVPLLMRTHSPFHIHCAWVSVCVGICAHSLDARGTLPPNSDEW